jgi:hypothetical protein
MSYEAAPAAVRSSATLYPPVIRLDRRHRVRGAGPAARPGSTRSVGRHDRPPAGSPVERRPDRPPPGGGAAAPNRARCVSGDGANHHQGSRTHRTRTVTTPRRLRTIRPRIRAVPDRVPLGSGGSRSSTRGVRVRFTRMPGLLGPAEGPTTGRRERTWCRGVREPDGARTCDWEEPRESGHTTSGSGPARATVLGAYRSTEPESTPTSVARTYYVP